MKTAKETDVHMRNSLFAPPVLLLPAGGSTHTPQEFALPNTHEQKRERKKRRVGLGEAKRSASGHNPEPDYNKHSHVLSR